MLSGGAAIYRPASPQLQQQQLYSIILPTYNERLNLPILVYLIEKHLSRAGISYEIIIVDDNSPDGTFEVAKRLQSHFGSSKIILAPRPGKLGLGTQKINSSAGL